MTPKRLSPSSLAHLMGMMALRERPREFHEAPCECCDHPLQHAISAIIARYEAPIPPPTAREIIEALRDQLNQWESDQ